MKYTCLRDCFVRDRLWLDGKVYDLPTDFPIYEKNFKLADKPETQELSPDATESTPEVVEENICPICLRICKSAFGLESHMRVHK